MSKTWDLHVSKRWMASQRSERHFALPGMLRLLALCIVLAVGKDACDDGSLLQKPKMMLCSQRTPFWTFRISLNVRK